MYEQIIERLLSFPQRGQIKIDFDLKKKTFYFSIPIYSAQKMPQSVEKYVQTRKDFHFKPHTTSFQMDGNKVFLMQEVPFEGGFQDSLRQQVDHFWKMSRQCHRMLSEIAVEEQFKDALFL